MLRFVRNTFCGSHLALTSASRWSALPSAASMRSGPLVLRQKVDVVAAGWERLHVDARASMDSKFWGQYMAARYAQIRPKGSITLFSGILSRRPSAGLASLAAINAAVEALGRALAVELAPVRVNVVSPGTTDTPAYSEMPADARMGMFAAFAKQREFPDAGVTKALNTVNCEIMVQPSTVPGDHDLFICGNDAWAKGKVTGWLCEWFGWKSSNITDLGDIHLAAPLPESRPSPFQPAPHFLKHITNKRSNYDTGYRSHWK
jgi:hypothetical protein